MTVSATFGSGIYGNSRYNIYVISGSTSFGFTTQGLVTKREYISGSSSLTLSTSGHLEGTAKAVGLSVFTFTAQGDIEAKRSRIRGLTSLTFIPSVSIRGVRKARSSISFVFDTSADIFGKGKAKGSTAFNFSSIAAINRVRIYSTHTTFSFSTKRAKIEFTNAGPDFNTWGDNDSPYTVNTSSPFDLLYRETSGTTEKPYLEVA